MNASITNGLRLSDRTISYEELLQHVIYDDSDVVLAAGSLVRGYGNERSDIDVYVFTEVDHMAHDTDLSEFEWYLTYTPSTDVREEINPEPPKDAVIEELFRYIQGTRHAVHVCYIKKADLKKLVRQFQDFYEDCEKSVGMMLYHQLIAAVGEYDFTRMGKYLGGIALRNNPGYNELFPPTIKEQFCYIGYRTHNVTFNETNDLVGMIKKGDAATAAHFARDYMLRATWAFSFLVGEPNAYKKWVVDRVGHWPEAYRHLADWFMRLYFCDMSTDDKKLAFCLEMLDFCDAVLLAGVELQESSDSLPSPQICLDVLEEAYENAPPTEAMMNDRDWELRLFSTDVMPTRKVFGFAPAPDPHAAMERPA